MNSANVTNLTKIRQTLTFGKTTWRDGYNKSAEFDENDEFGKSDGFDEISLVISKATINQNAYGSGKKSKHTNKHIFSQGSP